MRRRKTYFLKSLAVCCSQMEFVKWSGATMTPSVEHQKCHVLPFWLLPWKFLTWILAESCRCTLWSSCLYREVALLPGGTNVPQVGRLQAAAQWKREGFCKNVRNVTTFSAFLFKFLLFLFFFLPKSMLMQMNRKLSCLPEVFRVHSVHEGPNPVLEALTGHSLKIFHCFIFPKLIH